MFKNITREQLKVPAHVDYLAELRDFVSRIGRKHGVPDKTINAFKLAIDEAGTNIVRHAYREFEEPGFILLRVIVRKASITVSLIDQGKYFDPRGVKNPDLKRYVEIGKKGGLGIFIIRKLMDEIDYRKTEEGNELRLTKYREPEKAHGLQSKVNTIPVSLKAKYFIRTALVVTTVVMTGYLYFYYKAGSAIKASYLGGLYNDGERITGVMNRDGDIPHSEVVTLDRVLKIYEDNKDKIYEIFVVDNDGIIKGHSNEKKFYSSFERPVDKKNEVRDKIFHYSINDRTENDKRVEMEIYDYISTLIDSTNSANKGELHIRVRKADIDKEISARRWQEFRLALVILFSSYAGVIILIYVLLNPFRKLADWISALDHGDEVQDEMDIDSSTEIGEIAKAFSEITTKFRASQKNLAQQEQLQKEMQVAQEIQQTLLPSEFPELEGYEIASHYEAAKEVGGDYFDFVEVEKDTLGIVVADVSGKGVPGSLVMTMIRTALRTEARGMKDAAEVLARVNDFVVNDMKKGMFVTIFYVIIDSKRRRLNYASAGHNPMILYRPSTKKTYYLNPKGFPIGIQLAEKDLFRQSIESDTIQLAEEDILILYTDGITEAMNSRRDLFGEERFLKIIREHGHLRVQPFIDKLRDEMTSFTEGSMQYDDITLVTIKERTSPEKEELRRAKIAHNAIIKGTSIRDACEEAGITTYAYYNKYKKEFEEHGIENYEVDEDISVEAKHISIEDKTKIFDIIKHHPEYGAKRISEELNTEKYGNTAISENKIYDELVRSRLNTRQLREAFVARGGRNRRRMKPPGTPLLTLDGRVIIDREKFDHAGSGEIRRPRDDKKETGAAKGKDVPPVPIVPLRRAEDALLSGMGKSTTPEKNTGRTDTPSDRHEDAATKSPATGDKTSKRSGDTTDFTRLSDSEIGISFKDLFAGGSILYDEPSEKTAKPAAPGQSSAKTPPTPGKPAESEHETSQGDEVPFHAVDDLLKLEISQSFDDTSSIVIMEDEHSDDAHIPELADALMETAATLLTSEMGDAEAAETEQPAANEIDGHDDLPGDEVPEAEEAGVSGERDGRSAEESAYEAEAIPEASEEDEPEALVLEPDDGNDDEVEETDDAEAAIAMREAEEGDLTGADQDELAEESLEMTVVAELDAEQENEADEQDSPASTGTAEVFYRVSEHDAQLLDDAGTSDEERDDDTSDDLGLDVIQLDPDSEEAAEAADQTSGGTVEIIACDDVVDPAPYNGGHHNGLAYSESAASEVEEDADSESEETPEPAKAEGTQEVRRVSAPRWRQKKAKAGTAPAQPESEAEGSELESEKNFDASYFEETRTEETTPANIRELHVQQVEREQLLVEGLRFYKRHEFDRAIAQFRRAVEKYPDFKEAHSILGNAYFRKCQYTEATSSYNRVLELDPVDTTAHENMGVIYANQGQLDKAVQQWQKIVEIDPRREDIKRKIRKAMELLDSAPISEK